MSSLFIILFFIGACSTLPAGAYEQGTASWYGKAFHGRKTASGRIYNMHSMVAAHPELPFGSKVRVVNRDNGRQVIVTIVDRGPFVSKRIIDLSRAAAQKLGMIQSGVARVTLYLL